jgi:hypothetical protein
LQQVVDKVGNSAATVRKELGADRRFASRPIPLDIRIQQSGRQLRSRTAQLTYANVISSN